MNLNFKKETTQEVINASLISKYADEYLPRNVCVRKISGTACISDGIQEELSPFHPILIQAPTGFGKSWWIIHEVLPRVIEKGGKMLLVSNRIAVSYQQKLEIMKVLNDDMIGCFTEIGIMKRTDFGAVKIMTFQALERFLETPEGAEYSKDVSVLVADEAHYFLADSGFNSGTGKLLEMLPKMFSSAIRIYLTATPEDVIVPLAEAEEAALRPLMERIGVAYSPFKLGEQPTLYCYRFESDKYATLPVQYFKQDSELLQKVKSTDESWLIFVSSKELGAQFVEEIGSDAILITAESKGSEKWIQLLKTERLPCRVLVSTTVLDCGINVHDESLKHVAILFEDRITFMQALGRKRLGKEKQQFTLYVKAVSKQRLSGLIKRNHDLLMLVDQIEKGTNSKGILESLWCNGSASEKALVYPPIHGRLKLNQAAVHKLHRQAYFYQRLREDINQYGDSAFPRIVHQWLGQPDAYNEENWLGSDKIGEAMVALQEFLEGYDGKVLNSNTEKEEFSSRVHEFFKSITGKSKRDDRGERYLKTAALNNCLKEIGIKGAVRTGGKDSWIFKINDGEEP